MSAEDLPVLDEPWPDKGGRVALLVLPLRTILEMLHEGRWLVALFIATMVLRSGFTAQNLLLLLMLTGAYFYFIARTARSLCLLLRMATTAQPWPPQLPRMWRPFARPNILSFALSFPRIVFLLTFITMDRAIWVWLNPNSRLSLAHTDRYFIGALVVTLPLLYVVMASARKWCARHRNIVVFWRFREEVATVLKAELTSILTAYGSVSVIQNAKKPVLDQTYVHLGRYMDRGQIEVINADDNWQNKLEQRLVAADIVVVDVTDMSHLVAWEITKAFKQEPPRLIILIGNVDYLFSNYQFASVLARELEQHVGDGALQLVAKLQRPLAYSSDLSIVVFAWRFFSRIRFAAVAGLHDAPARGNEGKRRADVDA